MSIGGRNDCKGPGACPQTLYNSDVIYMIIYEWHDDEWDEAMRQSYIAGAWPVPTHTESRGGMSETDDDPEGTGHSTLRDEA